MMLRVGVDASIDETVLEDFTREVRLVRVPEEPQADIEVDFWVAAMPPKILRRQWPHLKGVKVIQAPWAGVDTLLKLFPPGVTLCDARGVHDIPTAEWALAAILAMEKFLPLFIEMQRQGKWAAGQQAQQIDAPSHAKSSAAKSSPTKIKNPPAPIHDVADSTALIVGYGSIGQAVETRLAPFGAKFLRVARSAREGVLPASQLDDLLGQADIVVLTTPLTSETRHLMDAERLAKMKPGALLVNAARGPLVDTDALLRAPARKKNSRGRRRNRSRAAAAGTSLMECAQPSDYAARGGRQCEVLQARIQTRKRAGGTVCLRGTPAERRDRGVLNLRWTKQALSSR